MVDRRVADELLAEISVVVDVVVSENGDTSPGLPVRYQPMDEPRLDELNQQENLEAIVAGGRDEFERILLLKDWVAAQWPHSYPDPYPPWDALVILDWIRSGQTGGYCAQYAQVLLQSLAALGFTGRYLEVGSVDNPYAHYVAEVWSNQFNKWIMLDVDYNAHFERAGTPLSALEIHDALVRSQLFDVDVVLGESRSGHPDPRTWPLQTAELYYYVRLHLKADHLTGLSEPDFDRYNDMVEWHDELTVPWELSIVESPYKKRALTNLTTDDLFAFDHRLNQVRVTVDSIDGGKVLLGLANNVRDFEYYQVRDGGDLTDDWHDHRGGSYLWAPARSARALETLEVRGVNVRGVAGPVSVVSAFLGR